LTRGVLKALFLTRLQWTLLSVVLVGLLAAGVGALGAVAALTATREPTATRPADPPASQPAGAPGPGGEPENGPGPAQPKPKPADKAATPLRQLEERRRELEEELTRVQLALREEIEAELNQIDQAARKAEQGIQKAFKAGDMAALRKAQTAFWKTNDDRF